MPKLRYDTRSFLFFQLPLLFGLCLYVPARLGWGMSVDELALFAMPAAIITNVVRKSLASTLASPHPLSPHVLRSHSYPP